ncbi:hypothetical protein CIPAW_10G129700 [Carya illinoinensis]|uniref:Uncharacterized protein n=1 Tax=Carya illinoinensis TaxID=32201 RepID=A0A8T1PCE0_CARIL|nr:hypothetical protein CIPAW_10G129700 [Carya illinoinensis]
MGLRCRYRCRLMGFLHPSSRCKLRRMLLWWI